MSPADLADLRRQNPKTAKLQQPQTTCLSLRNNAACCIPLRDLRNLRENNTQAYSIYIAQMKTQKSPADLADNRRQTTKHQNNKTSNHNNHTNTHPHAHAQHFNKTSVEVSNL